MRQALAEERPERLGAATASGADQRLQLPEAQLDRIENASFSAADDRDPLEGGIGLAMASPAQPTRVGHPARRRDRARAAALRERRFRPYSCGIITSDDHHFGDGVWTDPERLS